MKKLYISCPMKGRTEAEIEKSRDKMHRIAEAVFDQDLELINTFVSFEPPATKAIAIWNLGENIKKMATADYYIGISNWTYTGCNIEREIAESYGITTYLVSLSVLGISEYDEPHIYADDKKVFPDDEE